jgi:two-component system, chemotaxis family, CheB/CheR fusion protein
MKRTRAGRRTARPVTTHSDTDRRDGPHAGGSFPIVGIGASAGGLEAFSALLKNLPLDTGMGFVLVQHLDPVHDSALTQLLGRATSLPVHEVTNNLRVEPNHVYVIPPNTNLGITEGVLTLGPRPKTRTPNRSIDFFFEALANDQRDRAIGVILSGTATDGTVGLEAIKAEGGITFAQDDSARYDSMPRSAVAAGSVDFVLSPEDIATELARIAKHPAVIGALSGSSTQAEADRASATAHEDDETLLPSGGRTPPTGAKTARAEADRGARETIGDRTEEGFKKILLLLRRHSSVDFSLYKSSTIQRRILRRIVLTKHDTLERYAQFLQRNDKELTALYSDVLISVTSFFRNPEAFEVLRRKVWPILLQQRGDEPLRVWTLGCSTGQEAYSIAMSFVEAADKAPRMRKLQVFATDLNDALLDKARHGLYAKNIAQDLSPERLRRFFVEEEGGYRVGKALREMIVFARQNVMSDPPFSRLDIISCRNLLIYFEPGLQKKVFPVFHYALKPGGYLYLGASESIGGFTELFEPLDKKHKIYTKKATTTPAFHLPARKDHGERSTVSRQIRVPLQQQADERGAAKGSRGELSAQREADRVSVNQFAPPAVLINADLQILQFRGPTAAYLEPPTGNASFDLLKMARTGLMIPLRSAINKAKKENATARKHVRIEENGKVRDVNLEVIPLKNLRERCFLVVFKDADADGATGATSRGKRRSGHTSSAHADRAPRAAESRRNALLEAELAEMRDYAQSIQEQHEAANEELQASNEEVQSANEELQSINEELETSKEELESANEELTTVNEEMANRHTELNRLHSDLVNIQTSAHQAIVLLGRDLTIRRFSVPAEKQLNLMASDVGRPFSHVRHSLAVSDLESFITEVIDSVRATEREVQDKDGRWFSLQVRPYMTPDNRVDGAVLVLVDINDLKRSELAIASAREYAENIIGTMREPLLVLDASLRVESVNRAFYRTFGVSPADTIGKFIYELGNGQWDIPELRALLEEILPQNHTIEDFLVEWGFEHLGRRSMLFNARRMHSAEGTQGRIVVAIEDITARKRAEEAQASLAAIVASSDDAIISKDLTGVITSWNSGAERLFGYSAQEAVGQPITLLIPPDRFDEEHGIVERIRRGEGVDNFETVRRRKDGTLVDVSVAVSPVRDRAGTVVGASKIARDITERKTVEAAVRDSEERYRTLFDLGPVAVYSCDAAGVIQKFNRRAAELWGREPAPGDTDQRFCGSFKMFRPDGSFMPHEQCPMAEVVAGTVSEVRDGEVHIERPDGTRVTVVVNIRPLKNQHGEIAGAINCFYDITERKQIEETLRDADRRKNEFLAMLAHELRNPLAPILVSIEILRRAKGLEESDLQSSQRRSDGLATSHDLSDGIDHALDVLQRQVSQMVRLVDDLLDAGRISRGKIDLRRERVELSSVVYHVVEAARPISERREQELTVTLPSEPMYVDGDPTRLGQIVGNLLNNACKFTERGGHVWLTVKREGESGADHAEGASVRFAPQVVISVRDTGIGIAADQLEHVFDMFTQVDTSLERSLTGLGIGLTLVKTLTEMHGGTVEVHSAGAGQGSEFVVRLPLAVETDTPSSRPAPTRSVPTSPLRILIVDDSHDSADMLATLLQFTGHETFTAHDGLAAVEAAARLDPDVILLDIGLPILNGYEAARRIREQRGQQRRPLLIALTGWGQEEDRRRSEEAGFDAHLVKPVDDAVLGSLLAELSAGKQEIRG